MCVHVRIHVSEGACLQKFNRVHTYTYIQDCTKQIHSLTAVTTVTRSVFVHVALISADFGLLVSEPVNKLSSSSSLRSNMLVPGMNTASGYMYTPNKI